MSDPAQQAGGPRKPRIALMGEFSAGKSTLSNLLLGARPLPEKVTATRLSPVWMSYGNQSPYREDVDGTTEPVSLDRLEGIPVEETRFIRLFMEADILDVIDLIDFPGISDPNMDSDVWERVLPEVDAVIWCTHATQAWRQSEAAVWENMPDAVREHSILLITRYDKLTTVNDRRRVFKRVRRETNGQFGGTFPISLLQALEAGDDYDKWDGSGAGPFVDHLIETIQKLADLAARSPEPLYNIANGMGVPEPVVAPVIPRRVQRPLDADKPKRERPPAPPESGTG
ncbi:dynamin family protein [Yoonia sp. 2307UL14-13]|uniref:dynamin family protein n=1 Tax=Yoonia sp. 2307UL14-13 TaxID=3126506 RepID=UPI0030A370C4